MQLCSIAADWKTVMDALAKASRGADLVIANADQGEGEGLRRQCISLSARRLILLSKTHEALEAWR